MIAASRMLLTAIYNMLNRFPNKVMKQYMGMKELDREEQLKLIDRIIRGKKATVDGRNGKISPSLTTLQGG